METISLKINGIATTTPKGTTTLEAARLAHIEIPTLCFLKEISEIGACRICIVELKNGKLVTFCVYLVEEGTEVSTDTPKALNSREKTLQFLLSNHNRSCLSCVRNGHCEPQGLAHEPGVEDEAYYDGEKTPSEIDYSVAYMTRDNSKCILCRRCVAVCDNIQGIGVIGVNHHGSATDIGSAFEIGLGETSCVSCGQCIAVCPTGALTEKDYTGDVFAAIADPAKHVIVQTALAARAGLSKELGLPTGTDAEGRMAAALHHLGFDKALDTNFSVDLTIMEEAHESLDRVQNGGVFPLTTPCSPGRIEYCEHYFSDMIENLSSCKFLQQMLGAIAKSCYVERAGIDLKNIVSVSVMPCTAKKLEIGRDDQDANGVPDVDIPITTRELARVIKKSGIRFLDLPNEKFDDPLGLGTGVAVTFGVTGDVMEATLRTVVETLTGEELPKLDFEKVHGTKEIKEAIYNVAGMDVKVAVVPSLGNTKELLEKVKSGEVDYHFIEIMGCPGGCVNGGGQSQQPGHVHNTTDIRGLRVRVLYDIDSANPTRKSYENLATKELYSTCLGEPGSERAHHLFHTTYVKRTINKKIVNEKSNTVIEVGGY